MTAPGVDSGTAALTALLAWYREIGVDVAVSETAIDWLARGDTRPGAGFELPSVASVAPVAPTPAPAIARAAPSVAPAPARSLPPQRSAPTLVAPPAARAAPAPDEATIAARELARRAMSLEELGELLAAFEGCGLKKTAKSLCFYRGAARARVMVIGGAPGADEDKLGKPFVGPAGQLLDRMLAPIGLDETTVHITNTVYWRPPGNRPSLPEETLACRPFLERQVELVKPDIILLLGGAAANDILDVPDGIMKLRGKWTTVTLGGHTARALATLHPSNLLNTPVSKRWVWRDMLAVEQALQQS